MRSFLKKLEIGSFTAPQAEVGQAFPCSVFSIGKEVRDDTSYSWNGLERGPMPLLTFQYTLQGMGMLRYESKEFKIPTGHAMLVHYPHDHQYWFPPEGDPWHFFWITFHSAHIEKYWETIERTINPVVEIEDDSPIFANFVDIYQLLSESSLVSPYQISALGYQFVMNLLETLLNPVKKNLIRKEIQKVIAFCEVSFPEQIGVEEMANVSGLSRYHFTRLFQEIVGIAPGNFLRNIRMQHGTQLLREGMHTIKEVANLCGYDDPNNFCRAFKKMYGMSPGVFKKSGL